MFPSNNNRNNDPIAYIDHSILHRHFSNDINISYSKQEDLIPLSFFHYPSPCYHQLELAPEEDYGVFLQPNTDLLLDHQHQALTTDNSVSETIVNMPENEGSTINCTKNSQQIERKRSSKRDRHSKIHTAKGPRDRRMRLSLEVAREFFGLQDMLGYDKASRTVEWLLIKANSEIKKLAKSQLSHMNNNSCSVAAAAKSPSSASEGEVVSGIDHHKAGVQKDEKASTKEKKVRQPRKITLRPLARDLRAKARARAKARTKAKNMWAQRLDESKLCDDDLNKFTSWSSVENGEESAVPEVKELSSHDVGDESLAIVNSSIFNCLQNAGINQEHQLTSFLSFAKPWEAYNSQNL